VEELLDFIKLSRCDPEYRFKFSFSTITSAGGGGGGHYCGPENDLDGGSGGGGTWSPLIPLVNSYLGGAGNTPPVSPPQGNPGGKLIPASPTMEVEVVEQLLLVLMELLQE
jgi:hypothetical protein